MPHLSHHHHPLSPPGILISITRETDSDGDSVASTIDEKKHFADSSEHLLSPNVAQLPSGLVRAETLDSENVAWVPTTNYRTRRSTVAHCTAELLQPENMAYVGGADGGVTGTFRPTSLREGIKQRVRSLSRSGSGNPHASKSPQIAQIIEPENSAWLPGPCTRTRRATIAHHGAECLQPSNQAWTRSSHLPSVMDDEE